MSAAYVGPTVGLVAQVAQLALLANTVGLGVAGWVTGVGCGVVTAAVLSHGLARAGTRGFGPADWVTLARATFAGTVAALVADAFWRPVPIATLVTIAAVGLALDAVDGPIARRTGTASAFGARFDMEVDAFLILALSVHVARALGAWVLVIGAMRYGFVAAGWMVPWLRRPLPFRYWRKVVAAVQGVVLVSATAAVLPTALVTVAVVVALLLLVESFGRDVWWLYRHRATP